MASKYIFSKDLSFSPSELTPAEVQIKGAETDSSFQIATEGAKTGTPPGNRAVYLGMWTQGFFDPPSDTLHPEVLKSLEDKIGKKVAIAHYYRGWESLDSPKLIAELEAINSNGWRPMLSVNPYFFSKCNAVGLPLYRAIAQGNCDQFLKDAGRNLKQLISPMFLRFAWEMNVSSIPWQVARVGSTNDDFVAAWRKIHDVIYSEGATNVLFVFAPDVANTNYADFYPGNGYVDWVGLDGYNWGKTQSWSSWQGFGAVFSSAYSAITAVAPNKPLMISEVNSTDAGGDKAAWYQDMLSMQIPQKFPKVRAIVFYNEDRSVREGVNWLIDVTAGSLKSFSENVKNPIYLSSF